MAVILIVNPVSGGGRGARSENRVLDALRRRFGTVDLYRTRAPGDASDRARAAAGEGYELVVAMGGDGTISECVSGILSSVRPDMPLAFVSTGRGCDFASQFGSAGSPEAWVERIRWPQTRKIDAGEIRFDGETGNEPPRYFNNIASFGVSGHIARRVNRARRIPFLPARALFFVHSLIGLATYKPVAMRLSVEGREANLYEVTLAVVANGPRFGGGMKIAPMAITDDGLFDIVIIPAMARWKILLQFGRIYRGTHFRNPDVIHVRGRSMTIECADGRTSLSAEIDGEAIEIRSVAVNVQPAALTLAM